MNVYALFHCIAYEGSTLLGIYQYLSQAQEAEYAYKLEHMKSDAEIGDWTEIREVTLGAAPSFDAGEEVEA